MVIVNELESNIMATVIKSNQSKYVGKDFTLGFGKKFVIQTGIMIGTKIPYGSICRYKMVTSQHITKGFLGTVAGAAVGGLLCGGIGAVVGGLATGNKKLATTSEIALEFDNGDWIVISVGDGLVDREVRNELVRNCSSLHENPFND